ncbi:hypothetical protein GCM10007421_22430 [Halopseudomonas oceani]|uniref:virulence factor TspB C-terminal domain-related protein n=1 Tax=Halopseudomonas oceani TaxID=1708783 RepID=UPI0019A64AC6|nr:virulence factor TspB C-terminal domain-related protein [Halopseudomonas oceani]GGE47672.1 hypothetical protein GCM10007421_22430 [Halopseudomonas oceani]
MRFLLLSLLILSTSAFGGTRVTPNVGTNSAILNSSNSAYLSGNVLWKQGDTATSYIERLGRHTPVGVTPSRGVPTGRIVSAAKDLIRLSPTSVVASVGLMAIVEGAGWAIDELTGQISVREQSPVFDNNYIYWYIQANGQRGEGATPMLACQAWADKSAFGDQWEAISYTLSSYNHGTCLVSYTQLSSGNSGTTSKNLARTGSGCPSGTSYSDDQYGCIGTIDRPVLDSDISKLSITGDASFYDGLMRDACDLSASPSRCFDSLVEQRRLSGPATVEGPKTTTTSTQTNADGSTSTVEKETRTQYDIEYGDDHYVYTPKTTTETKVDGQTTETTTEQEDTSEDSEQKPEEEMVSEISGLNCEASIACSGDAIQCAIASTQKDTKCILQDALDFPTQQSEITSIFQGDEFALDEEEIEIPSFINQGTRFLPSTCPAPIALALSGKTLQLDTQPFCTFANDLSFLIVAFSALGAALYVGRAFGGE